MGSMHTPFELETPRLSLVPLTVEHREAPGQVYADPDVARYVGGDRLTDEAIDFQIGAFVAEWLDDRGTRELATGTVITANEAPEVTAKRIVETVKNIWS